MREHKPIVVFLVRTTSSMLLSLSSNLVLKHIGLAIALFQDKMVTPALSFDSSLSVPGYTRAAGALRISSLVFRDSHWAWVTILVHTFTTNLIMLAIAASVMHAMQEVGFHTDVFPQYLVVLAYLFNKLIYPQLFLLYSCGDCVDLGLTMLIVIGDMLVYQILPDFFTSFSIYHTINIAHALSHIVVSNGGTLFEGKRHVYEALSELNVSNAQLSELHDFTGEPFSIRWPGDGPDFDVFEAHFERNHCFFLQKLCMATLRDKLSRPTKKTLRQSS